MIKGVVTTLEAASPWIPLGAAKNTCAAPNKGILGVLSTRRCAGLSYNGAGDAGCQIEGVKDVKGGRSRRVKKGKIERDGRENARKPTQVSNRLPGKNNMSGGPLCGPPLIWPIAAFTP